MVNPVRTMSGVRNRASSQNCPMVPVNRTLQKATRDPYNRPAAQPSPASARIAPMRGGVREAHSPVPKIRNAAAVIQ